MRSASYSGKPRMLRKRGFLLKHVGSGSHQAGAKIGQCDSRLGHVGTADIVALCARASACVKAKSACSTCCSRAHRSVRANTSDQYASITPRTIS